MNRLNVAARRSPRRDARRVGRGHDSGRRALVALALWLVGCGSGTGGEAGDAATESQPDVASPDATADARSDADDADAKDGATSGDAFSCPPDFCKCPCDDGSTGYRPQCGLVTCTYTDPCISGIVDGGWVVCGL